ncbi:MAG: hypothetical protein NVSMB9_12000 [Isosphaeraceae bacterium]
MDTILGWISDPYVHVFMVALVLARLVLGETEEDRSSPKGGRPIPCWVCHKSHEESADCPEIRVRGPVFLNEE